MSHKLISNKSVIYDAQTLQESVLTIVCPNLNFENNMNQVNLGIDQHFVSVNGRLYAKFDTQERVMLNILSYGVPEDEWNSFYDSQTFTTSAPYDKDMECALFYIKSKLTNMFGLTPQDWIFVL